MGSSASKPVDAQVWKGTSPPGVSQDLVEALQSSPETDVSRLQSLELAVQARVAAELRRLQSEEAAALREAQEKLSTTTPDSSEAAPRTRQTVSKEVEALRAKLEERRKVRQLPDSVEAARGDVVRCLRENDRRPLDCWKEVEAFKEEVRRLEKGWVEKVIN
ncbi:hypothetical protein B0T19DRAFT_471920 [Cercophora scortea]|uniref:Altered inheritance of mitochondria protein 13, mitochondrial n=1 Tax=Cercophora scortea TaxID=314031 RepID=A0AAE0MLV9_9PEZI|nr:hypothetical protein B0T19DRAFT_471920 [Cercophora scortea]